MKGYLRAAVLGLVLAAAAGCVTPAATPTSTAVPQLTVYTSHKKEVYGPIVKEFQERTGIWVRVEEAGTNELLARIAGESGVCDVMFGGGVESLEAYADCFVPYRTAEATALDPAFCSPDDLWTPFSALPLVFLYNTKLLTAETAPQSWSALLDAQWAGRVAYADPGVSGSCYTALATAIQALPEWEQDETVAAFAAVAGDSLLDSSIAIYTGVSEGSFAVGVTLEESAMKQVKLGKDVAFLYPADGSSAVPDGTAIVKGGRNPEGAKRFVDFTVSHDVQRLLANQMSRRSVRFDVAPAPGLIPIDQISLVDYNVAWASARKRAILEQWNSLRPTHRGRGE